MDQENKAEQGDPNHCRGKKGRRLKSRPSRVRIMIPHYSTSPLGPLGHLSTHPLGWRSLPLAPRGGGGELLFKQFKGTRVGELVVLYFRLYFTCLR